MYTCRPQVFLLTITEEFTAARSLKMPLRCSSSEGQAALSAPSPQYRVGHVPLVILAACKGFQLAGDHAAIVSCDLSVLRKAPWCSNETMSLTDMMLSLTNMLPGFACYDHLVAAKRLGMFVDLSVIADLRLRVEHRHFVKEDAVRAAVKPRLHFGKDGVEVPAAVSRCNVDEHLNAAFVQPVHHLGLQVDKAGGSIVGAYDVFRLASGYSVKVRAQPAFAVRVPAVINDELAICKARLRGGSHDAGG